ncbi:glycosyltransferase [Paraeggerthella sp. Marseille-Q4926]|uniref:glycosyltransferase n=1 Tax=Paraeggerthella sp. Marseille-Q4926 TaxID=2866587 RepID=UPI001CE462A0|nr:glycosyltransferase [Paraeggerthella sp. Marseille-Q4926]
MRVLMVNKFHYFKGGSETYHFAVAESLERMGCEVGFFSMEDPSNLPSKQSRYFVSAADYNGKTGLIKKAKDGLSLIYSFEAKKKFEALLEDFQPDIIHMNLVHRQLTFSILDAPWLKAHKIPVVYTAHDYIPVCPNCTMLDGEGQVCDDCLAGSFKPCIKKRCVKGSKAKSMLATAEAAFLRKHGSYQKIDRIIAPSEFIKKKLVAGGFPSKQIDFMQNFAKREVLEYAKDDKDCTDKENPYLFFFGRLSKEKGVDVLVEAFMQALNKLPSNWNLVIAGDGPERDVLGDVVLRSGSDAKRRVEFVGFQTGVNLQEYVERASLSIVCSRWRENMPYSIIESFALGTPVIGTHIGGIPELVQPGGTGFLCNPNDAESLSGSIVEAVEFCSRKEGYQLMQSSCRKYVLSHCLEDEYVSNLIGLYEQLIEKKKETH